MTLFLAAARILMTGWLAWLGLAGWLAGEKTFDFSNAHKEQK
jgi:hypothetical protein